MSKPPSLTDQLIYGLSLPERMTRGASAVVGGLIGETSARLLPAVFRSSRSYNAFIQQSLDMLTHDVGGVAKPAGDPSDNDADAVPAEDIPLARKAVGGLLDIAGGATLHLSPVTMLALVSDMAYGSNVYLQQLAEELRRDGIIDDSSTITSVSDLLTVVADASRAAGTAAEAPPLDIAGMRETVRQLSEEIARADPASIIPQSELNHMWNDMRSIADASPLGLWQVGTVVGMHAIDRMDMATRGTLASIRVAGNLFDQHIFEHYEQSIAAVYNDGLFQTLQTSSAPYLDAVWENFSPARETWTAKFLRGDWLPSIFAGRSDSPPE